MNNDNALREVDMGTRKAGRKSFQIKLGEMMEKFLEEMTWVRQSGTIGFNDAEWKGAGESWSQEQPQGGGMPPKRV